MGVLKKYLFIIIFLVLIGVIFIGLIIYGSQIEEIKPGDGFVSSFRKVRVLASNEKWEETGISVDEISKKDKVILTISGEIFLCGGDDGSEKSEILVHASKCFGGISPNYPSEQEFLAKIDKKNPYGTYDWNSICNSVGGFDTEMKYEKIQNMKISQHDFLQFSLIPKEKIVTSCSNIPSDIIFANTPQLNSSQCREFEMENQKISRIINNDPSPRGNKLFWTNVEFNKWFVGSFADFRFDPNNPDVNDPNLKKDNLRNFNCSSLNPNLNNFLRSETLEINTSCNFFHRLGGGYKMSSYKKIKDGEEYAELLLAKIGGNEDWGSVGKACLANGSSNSKCTSSDGSKSKALRLNFPYEIKESNVFNDDLFLIIDDDENTYFNNLGGYNVSIFHTCPRSNGKSLYIYVGDEVPTQDVLNNSSSSNQLLELITNNDGEIDISSFIKSQNPGHKIFFIVKDNGDGYQNNKGSYEIQIEIESVPSLISDIMRWLIDPIKEFLGRNPDKNGIYQNGIVKDFYDGLINNGIRDIIRALILIFVFITSISFVVGITELKFSELMKMLFKISFILILLTDTSWEFLNKNFFNMFWFGAEYLVSAFAKFFGENENYDYNSVFIFFDRSIGYLFNWKNLIRFLSLICGGFFNPLNFFVAIVIGKGLFNIITAFFKGVVLYVSALIVSGFLIAISPIFICFILFKNTYQFFDTWIKQLIMYTTVPALFFIVVGFLNEILFFSIFQIFNFGTYTECLLPISFGGGLDICILYFPMPFANNTISLNLDESYADMVTSIIPVSLMHLINFAIISKAYLFTLEIIPILASMVFGGSPRFSVTDVANEGVEGMKYAIGMDQGSLRRRNANQTKIPKGQYKDDSKGAIRAGFKTDNTGGE